MTPIVLPEGLSSLQVRSNVLGTVEDRLIFEPTRVTAFNWDLFATDGTQAGSGVIQGGFEDDPFALGKNC